MRFLLISAWGIFSANLLFRGRTPILIGKISETEKCPYPLEYNYSYVFTGMDRESDDI
jgi:hypothetical protein